MEYFLLTEKDFWTKFSNPQETLTFLGINPEYKNLNHLITLNNPAITYAIYDNESKMLE